MNKCNFQTVFTKLRRKKTLPADIMQTPLKRCLSVFDLILFGIGHMIGGGIYVLTGTVTRYKAGPGVVFSYMLAGVVSILVALCYAEFGSKIPKAGSTYVYTYIILGEFWAFFVGWNLVLEYVVGSASVARAWSGAVNVLSGGAVVNSTTEIFGTIDVPYLSNYFDFLAVAILIVLATIVAIGIQLNAIINNILTVANVIFLSFIVTVALIYAEPSNWLNVDHGGVLPFGFTGVLAGAAMCFFSFCGFESITQAAEETKNPGKAVPISALVTITIVTVLYVLASLALSMLAPYYSLDITLPFSIAFADRGVTWMMYVASIGTVIATTTTTLAFLYSLSRIIYSISADRLFFACFAYINPKTQTPITATIVFSLIAIVAAALIEINELAEMLSAGTLIAFSFLAIDVLVFRYLPINECPLPLNTFADDSEYTHLISTEFQHETNNTNKQNVNNIGKLKPYFANWSTLRYLSEQSKYSIPMIAISTMCTSGFFLLIILLRATEYLMDHVWWSVLLIILLCFVTLLSLVILSLHEPNTSFTSFQVKASIKVFFISVLRLIHSWSRSHIRKLNLLAYN